MKTKGELFIEEMELKKPRFNIQDLWRFSLKEICLNLECSEFDFCTDSKIYYAFKRRFDYFVKKKEEDLK